MELAMFGLASIGERPMASTRPRPAVLRALGAADPPESIFVDGQRLQRFEIFKHDSWAATALYESVANDTQGGDDATGAFGSALRVVCKFNRTQPIGILPMAWLGRGLARREQRAYVRLAHIPGIARPVEGLNQSSPTLRAAVAHHFIEGHPLGVGEEVNDEFFPELKRMLEQIHAASCAYVDLHKRENILVGRDGRPYLVDFQISLQARSLWLWKLPPWAWVLRVFQISDDFCLSKHVRQHRPDQLQPLGLDCLSQQPPWWIRVHRLFAVPFRQARRKLLSTLRVRDRSGRASSERFAEHAFRCPR
jgi:hypothetical protein